MALQKVGKGAVKMSFFYRKLVDDAKVTWRGIHKQVFYLLEIGSDKINE